MELHKKLYSLKYLLLALLFVVLFIFSVCSSHGYDENLLKIERQYKNSSNGIEELMSNVDSAQLSNPSNLALYNLLKIESLPISSNCSIVNPTEISQAEGVFKKNEDYARLSRLLLRRGQSEYVNNQFSESLEDFFTALLYIENFNIKSLEAQCYYRIAVVLKKLNFYADSWSFANKCVSSLQEDVESVKYKIESTLLLAEYETNAGNYHESIKLLNSLKTRQGIDNADINDKISALLIVPYFKMGYSKKAFEIFQDMKSRDSSFIYSELSPIVVASLLRENGEFAEAKDFIANYIERDGTCSQPHYSKCLTIPGSDSIVIYDNSLILEGELFTPDNVHLSPLQTFKTSQVKFFEQHDNPFFTKQSARKSIFLIAFFVIMISLIVLISIKYRYVNYQKKLSDEVSMDKSELQFKTEVALKSINQSRALLNKLCDEYYEKKDCKNLNVSLQKILEKEISVMRTSRFQESLIQEINNLYSNALNRLKENIPNIKQREILFCALLMSGLTARSISLVLDINVGNYYNIWTRLKQKIEKSSYSQKETLIMTIFKNN